MVKNDMTKPEDDAGLSNSMPPPKYRVVASERPVGLAKRGKNADVGLAVHAFSSKGALCRVEFQNFTLGR